MNSVSCIQLFFVFAFSWLLWFILYLYGDNVLDYEDYYWLLLVAGALGGVATFTLNGAINGG